MINVIVTYQVNKEFVEQNKKNIQLFLNDFKKLPTENFQYNIFLKEDGITFVHQSTYKDEATQASLLNTPSFKEFQKQRDESGLNNSHKLDILTYIGSVNKILK
ncbi:hypothetical protein [Flavobacterium adhaerens]|uniref:hypothetical protein n=1 Tax=Flavobacterium adhaerens TaxID=3149043 RepID=UPI0032B51C8E